MSKLIPITTQEVNSYYSESGVKIPQIWDNTTVGIIEGFSLKKDENEDIQGVKSFYTIVCIIGEKQILMNRFISYLIQGEEKRKFIKWLSNAPSVDAFFLIGKNKNTKKI